MHIHKTNTMLITTTNSIEGKRILEYYGLVSGETIIGANIFKDIFAGIRDIVGGRSGAYEEVMQGAREEALREMADRALAMGADAVIGVHHQIAGGEAGRFRDEWQVPASEEQD